MAALSRRTAGAVAWVLLLVAAPPARAAGVVAPELARELRARGPGERIPVIVELSGGLDAGAFAVRDRRLRHTRLLVALRERAARALPPFRAALDAAGATDVRELWLVNGLAARIPAAAVAQLARRPGVASVRLDAVVQVAPSTTAATGTPGWNVSAVRAPELWSAGLTGAGAVIAGMDSGVDPEHPDLAGKWRGGAGGWFDPSGQHATPHDASGHGTQTMGIMVGGAASGTAIGVAPDARWIAAKIFDDAGRGSLSGIHLAFQWLLDPDGDPATVDAPDVVDASWTLASGAGACDLEFQADLLALEAAGVGVVLAAGNGGPGAATSESPANAPGALSAGAVDAAAAVATFSSRGPSACDGGVFPTLVAPGVDVWTSDLSFGGFPSYAAVSGTSFAAPHVAGAMALLAAGYPAASLGELRSALVQGAADLGAAGADPDSGHGLVDVAAAAALLGPPPGSPPRLTSTPITTAAEGALYLYQLQATDPEGTAVAFSLEVAPAGMSVGADTGIVTWTPSAAQVGANDVVARATDGSGLSALQRFTIAVGPADRAPTSANDAYAATAGVALSVAAPGVLANDSDPDGDPIAAVLSSGPARGTLALAANGAFVYTPSAGFSGTDAFTYAASDGHLLGAAATVTITVVAPDQPPVAANDAFTAPYRKNVAYAPQALAVLANDRDPDGSVVASSVRIVSAPSQGGTATVNANGTVSYTPKQRFKGTETFAYDVKDDRGVRSNVAKVSIKVQ